MADDRPPAVFIAGSLGLDFVNSYSTPQGVWTDRIVTGEDLLNWSRQVRLVSGDELDSQRKAAGPGELDAVAAQARDLREWFRGFVRKHQGEPLGPVTIRQLAPLNRMLARDEQFGQIVAHKQFNDRSTDARRVDKGTSALRWMMQYRWRRPETLLLPIARAMAELVCTDDFTRVKSCDGAECVPFFVDRSRRRARRWCDMAVCGNRAKQTAHRRRNHNSRRFLKAKN
jgi:predicted RNA-binding Zn ribbon-like protein